MDAILQLCFDLPEPADDHLETLLTEELNRDDDASPETSDKEVRS